MELHVLIDNCIQTVPFADGQTILEALRASDASVHAPCGGRGTCRKCTVLLIRDGTETPVLACRTRAEDGMTIRLPESSELSVSTSGTCERFTPDDGLTGYGIACDIGTTTVVCRLVDLRTGTDVGHLGRGNAQHPFGADVIARIHAASRGYLDELNAAICRQLDDMIRTLCSEAGIPASGIRSMTVAANTTMCHLLTGLDPTAIGQAPFTPRSFFGCAYPARDLGLSLDAPVYLAPAVSGYVGGDITADLIAAGMDLSSETILMIDIGTNGEMALSRSGHVLCCSTAAGPAFEGAEISCGMVAAPGAISRIGWEDHAVSARTIANLTAKGICGSGLIDAVAMFLDLGVIDETGRMLDPDEDDIPAELEPYIELDDDSVPRFRITDDIFISQADIRKVQLGKGAIAAGVEVLLQHAGISCDEISSLLLAGGFGSFIDPASAARIGLFPEELLPVTRAIGNAAADGAQLLLISEEARRRISEIKADAEYIELSGSSEFNNAYLDAMTFPEVD